MLAITFGAFYAHPTWSQQRTLAPELSGARASVAAHQNDSRISEGDPVFVEVDDRRIKLKIESLRISRQGNQLLRAASTTARLVLVGASDGSWQGRLSLPTAAYRATGELSALQLSPLAPDERRADKPKPTFNGKEMAMGVLRTQTTTTNPSIIDVLVIRDPDVDPAYIDLSVLFANDAFYASNVPLQLRIHTVETVEIEAGTLEEVLERAALGEDELNFDVAPAYGADIAAVFVENDPDTCGIAYINFYKLDDRFFLDAFQYSVTSADCNEAVFAHEVGHNLGALHDRENSDEGDEDFAAFPYAFAHRDGVFGTIMSYAPFLDPFFSNPDVEECGAGSTNPCGVAAGEENESDIARVFRFIAPFTAGIGNPLAAGASTNIVAGTDCRPAIPGGNDGLEWRDRGLVNNSGSTIDVRCPISRASEVSEAEESDLSYFVSMTNGNESESDIRFECTLVETIGKKTGFAVTVDPRMPPTPESGYEFTFPRVTPMNAVLSTYSVGCRVPPGGVIQKLTITAIR